MLIRSHRVRVPCHRRPTRLGLLGHPLLHCFVATHPVSGRVVLSRGIQTGGSGSGGAGRRPSALTSGVAGCGSGPCCGIRNHPADYYVSLLMMRLGLFMRGASCGFFPGSSLALLHQCRSTGVPVLAARGKGAQVPKHPHTFSPRKSYHH